MGAHCYLRQVDRVHELWRPFAGFRRCDSLSSCRRHWIGCVWNIPFGLWTREFKALLWENRSGIDVAKIVAYQAGESCGAVNLCLTSIFTLGRNMKYIIMPFTISGINGSAQPSPNTALYAEKTMFAIHAELCRSALKINYNAYRSLRDKRPAVHDIVRKPADRPVQHEQHPEGVWLKICEHCHYNFYCACRHGRDAKGRDSCLSVSKVQELCFLGGRR
jgi:hypothetical protein